VFGTSAKLGPSGAESEVNNFYSGSPVLGSHTRPRTTSCMAAAASSATGQAIDNSISKPARRVPPGLKQNPREIHRAPLAGLQVSIAVDPLARFELQAMPFTRAAFASRSSLFPDAISAALLPWEPLIALAQFVREIVRRDTA
jgi:hypothetical protein